MKCCMKNIDLNVVALRYLPWAALTLEDIRSENIFFSALWFEYPMVKLFYYVNVICFFFPMWNVFLQTLRLSNSTTFMFFSSLSQPYISTSHRWRCKTNVLTTELLYQHSSLWGWLLWSHTLYKRNKQLFIKSDWLWVCHTTFYSSSKWKRFLLLLDTERNGLFVKHLFISC